MQRLCGFGCVGLVRSKGGERASSVALPQPAANGAFAVAGRSEGIGLAAQTKRSGVRRLCGFFSAEQRLPTERSESVTK